MAQPKVTINRRQLNIELSASDPILKTVAEQVLREAFFEPAVDAMRQEFESHKVTNEIAGGPGASNISDTLEGVFREQDSDTTPNLWGFIGFDLKGGVTPETALDPIAERLDPKHPDGPKMTYVRRDKEKLTYEYRISAPNEARIFADKRGHLPWAPGISWIKRIEQGLPGVPHFLNVNRRSSRSTGGIQVEGQVRNGRFRPVSYMSRIFNNFLRRVAGRSDNGRRI